VVADSIVVIENITRHLVAGRDRAATIVLAVREVAGAITASTITTVTVFLPISFVGGSTGELFRPFALTVTIALLASLLVSLTIVPVLAYWFLRTPAPKVAPVSKVTSVPKVEPAPALAPAPVVEPVETTTSTISTSSITGGSEISTSSITAGSEISTSSTTAPSITEPRRHRHAVPDATAALDELEHPSRLQEGYLPIIRWTLKHAVATLLLAVFVLVGTVALVPFMKVNFLGSTGQTTFRVIQTLPVGTSLAAQDEASLAVEDSLRATDGVKTVQVSIGGGGLAAAAAAFQGGAPSSSSVTYSVTTDGEADPDEVQEVVREELTSLTDVGEVSVAAAGGLGSSSNIEVDVTAATDADLAEATDAILAEVRQLDAITESSSNLAASRPYIAVTVDRDAAASVGLSELALGSIVSQTMQPTAIGSIVIDEANLSVYLQADAPPTTTADLAALPIPTAAGPVPLDSLATVEEVQGPSTITTTKGLRTATVSATPAGDDLGTANAQIATALAQSELPSSAEATIGGVTSDQTEAFQQLGIAMLAAILIVYIIMVATFRSLVQPLLLLVSVPFAATGAILLQVITGIPLGVASLIGVLMLIGIVVTNAIVLVDLVNQYRRRGLSVLDALVQGASRRLRPILMTALATIFALLPMAIGLTGHGGFISQPLALVVVGGLVSSTVLTLIVLPVLYYLVEGGRERRAIRKEERGRAAASAVTASDLVPTASRE